MPFAGPLCHPCVPHFSVATVSGRDLFIEDVGLPIPLRLANAACQLPSSNPGAQLMVSVYARSDLRKAFLDRFPDATFTRTMAVYLAP